MSLTALPLCTFAAAGPDAEFYQNAAQGSIAEVELGSLALKKAGDPTVRTFAAQIVKEHTDANDKLRAVADGRNVTLPKHESASEQATKAKLQMLSGAMFDKAYIKAIIKDQEQNVREFKKEAEEGRDPNARAYAAATLPSLMEHLQRVRAMADKI